MVNYLPPYRLWFLMPKRYHIDQEINRVALELASKGLLVRRHETKRNVPVLIVNEKVSLCFFWNTKRWKAFEWMVFPSRTITEKDPKKIVSFVTDYFEEVTV